MVATNNAVSRFKDQQTRRNFEYVKQENFFLALKKIINDYVKINLLNPTGYVMHQQFNIQQLYGLPSLYLCVLYLSENKQWLLSHIT